MKRRDHNSTTPRKPSADAEGPEIAPLDPELAALLEVERVPPPVNPDLAARLLARVESSVASAGGAAAAAGAKASLGAAKAVLVALLAGGGLAAVLLVTRQDEAPPPPPPEPPAMSHIAEPEEEPPAILEEAAEAATDGLEGDEEEPGDEAAGPAPEAAADAPDAEVRQDEAPQPRPRRPPPAPAPLEHVLLKDARAALGAGELKEARRHLDHHRRAYPRGVLGEEREVLEIRLALALGRSQRAQDLLIRFRTRYPGSLHLPSLDATFGEGR